MVEIGINCASMFVEVKKATGLDNLSSKFLKIAADILAPSLIYMFSQPISSGIVPIEWKLAWVAPAFKRGARKDVNNYRPILSKIFEKIIYTQFYKYLKDNDLLANCQSGFR